MAPTATIAALTSTDINHLRMSAYNLAAIATDHGFSKLAAELADIPANDHVALIRYIHEIWGAVSVPMMQLARVPMTGIELGS